MATNLDAATKKSHAYDMFMLVLTVFSLIVMVALLLPLSDPTIRLLQVYDTLICVFFFIDFALNLARSRPRRDYFIGRRGWLDLLGSVPSLGLFRFTALLRLARLSRFFRITRKFGGRSARRELVQDVVRHRGEYAAFITVLAAFVVLSVSSVLVLQAESHAADANIKTGGGALWWAVVTITTVGYGDKYPVTPMGRITAVLVMFAGVGIIGALASILASILVPTPKTEEDAEQAPARSLQVELAQIRDELAALRRSITPGGPDPPAGRDPGTGVVPTQPD